jgi:hypothetical protein
MFPINHDDPLSTAAAALALAGALSPAVRAAVPGASRHGTSAECSDLYGRMAGARLFESQTVMSLHRLIADTEAGVQRETTDAVTWVPVRCIAGAEEFEAVTVARRTRQGDALADLAGRLRRLVALIERTETLLAAEHALAGRREGRHRRPSSE